MNTRELSTHSAQKSEAMRVRLMEATLDVLAREGWSGASTPKICKQAKVSRGAQTHHFPTKSSLLLAAIDWVAKAYQAKVLERMSDLEPRQRSLRAVLAVFWETFLDDRFLYSATEALVAARTDPDLREAVADLDKQAIASMRALAVQVSDPSVSLDRMEDVFELSLYYFRGIAVQRGVHADEGYRQHLFEIWCDMVESSLARP